MPISDLKITPGATGGNAISIPNTPAPKTLSTPAPNSNIVDDKALQNTVSPAVITSKNAANDLIKIKTNVADINTGIQTQAQKIAAAKEKADADAKIKAESDAKAKTDADNASAAKATAAAKLAAVNGTSTPTTPALPTDVTFTNQINRAPDQIKSVTTNGDGTRTVSYKDGTAQVVAKDPNTPVSAPTSTDDLSTQRVADAQRTFDAITGIQNGTIPLSDGENAQIEGLKQQFQKLISDQTLVNTGASGVANIRGYQTGSAEYDNSFQAKVIGSIITSGANKIADLNTKMASAVATLTQSFKDNDIAKIKEAYTILDDAKKDRQATIQKTIDEANQKVKDAQAQSNWQTNADLKQKTFEEKVKTDEFDKVYKLEDLELKRRAAQPNPVQNLPQVTLGGNGMPDAKTQTAFLNTLPGGAKGAMATAIQGLATYTINPNTFSSRIPTGGTESQRQQLVTMAKQYDPTFDETQYNARQALRTNFESGKYSQNKNSLNTAIGHLASLESTASTLHNRGFTPWNYIANGFESTFGAGNVTSAKTNLAAVAGELASSFKGSGATDTEIQTLGNIDSNSSPAQFKAYIEKGVELLSSRLNALNDTYTSGMGKPPSTPFLSDSSAKTLLGLKAEGLNIDVPALDETPAGKIYNLGVQNPSIQPTVTKMEADGVSSSAILDWINQNQ